MMGSGEKKESTDQNISGDAADSTTTDVADGSHSESPVIPPAPPPPPIDGIPMAPSFGMLLTH